MILSKRAYGVIISKNKTRKVFLFQQCCIAYFSDDFHAKLIFMCLKVSLRKISLCMKFHFCIYRAPKQEKKMSFERSKMENLFMNVQILPTNTKEMYRDLQWDSIYWLQGLRVTTSWNSPKLSYKKCMEASKENLLTDLRVSLSLPTVRINSLVLIRQEFGLDHILSSIFLFHGFPLVS